jgi:hypothetical protein
MGRKYSLQFKYCLATLGVANALTAQQQVFGIPERAVSVEAAELSTVPTKPHAVNRPNRARILQTVPEYCELTLFEKMEAQACTLRSDRDEHHQFMKYDPGQSTPTMNSCRYHGDGECDEPQHCDVGTDCTDCGACPVPMTAEECASECCATTNCTGFEYSDSAACEGFWFNDICSSSTSEGYLSDLVGVDTYSRPGVPSPAPLLLPRLNQRFFPRAIK